jgi:hypothetical protein
VVLLERRAGRLRRLGESFIRVLPVQLSSRLASLAGLVLVFALLLPTGCTTDDAMSSCPPGYLGCSCATGAVCLNGLVCQAGECSSIVVTTPSVNSSSPNATNPTTDAGQGDTPGNQPADLGPNADAFFAVDPPPVQCLQDGGMGPPPESPGGTPECPDDKNREGCPCENLGEVTSCWPGLRVNRNRGICRDGTTRCEVVREFGRWGPCEGYVLPADGVASGPASCGCFSAGLWEIDNLSPCFVDFGTMGTWAVSTYINGSGAAQCPSLNAQSMPPPPAEPGTTWSSSRLRVDCEGSFELCYTLRAGSADAASPNDCVVARACTGQIWYENRDQLQELPDLPSWTSTDSACSTQFAASGGYGEMSVLGLSVECDEVDDGSGGEFVFNRVQYCPLICATDPSAPGCENCNQGGSGNF